MTVDQARNILLEGKMDLVKSAITIENVALHRCRFPLSSLCVSISVSTSLLKVATIFGHDATQTGNSILSGRVTYVAGEVGPQGLVLVLGVKPVALILARSSTEFSGRGATCFPAKYSAVLIPVTDRRSRPAAAKFPLRCRPSWQDLRRWSGCRYRPVHPWPTGGRCLPRSCR